jgi:hypothetical protein
MWTFVKVDEDNVYFFLLWALMGTVRCVLRLMVEIPLSKKKGPRAQVSLV